VCLAQGKIGKAEFGDIEWISASFLRTIYYVQAVNTSSFQDSRFHVIDSVWESESFVGLRNFTLMAVLQKGYKKDLTWWA